MIHPRLALLPAVLAILVLAPSRAIAQVVAGASESPSATSYALGPQDRLMVRVHSLRRSSGEAYAWAPLNGEFTVGANGAVSLPIIGHVRATGGTTAELAEKISQMLREAANLVELPSTSVEVIRHRPFYVVGAVQQPGKYEFQPGMTVLQALSTAQGLARASELDGVERDMIVAGGDLRTLEAERIVLEAKMARLSAEAASQDKITFPATLTAMTNDPRAEVAMREETLRFNARRSAVAAEVEALDQSSKLLQQELTSLDAKGKSLDRQLEANKRELRLVSDLVSRGLTVSPRQIAAENTQVVVESNRLDVQVASLRAQQSLSRAARDRVEVQARYTKDALDDMVATRALLEANAQKATTAARLVRHAEARSPGSRIEIDELTPIYRLTRVTATGSRTWEASEDSRIEAGDVLQVVLPRAQRPRGQAGIATTAMPAVR